MIDISIIIVSWNVRDLLEQCLHTIFNTQGSLSLEVVVVDNASTDGTALMVKKKFSQVAIIENTTNRGFAAANNQGINASTGRYVLALNPDTELHSGALENALAFMDRHPRAGILGCQHLNPDGSVQPSVRLLPTWLPIFFIAIKITKLFTPKSVKQYLAHTFDYQKTQLVEQVAGSFFLMRRSFITAAGFFDEKFFIWFEEVDLCKKAKDTGWEVWYFAGATITHHGGQSFKQQLRIKNQWQFYRSALYYFKKHA